MLYIIIKYLICIYLKIIISVESSLIPSNLVTYSKSFLFFYNLPKYGFINPKNSTKLSQKQFKKSRRYNVPPPGSRMEFEINRYKSDPLNTSPWEYEVAIFESYEKGKNISHGFLKNDWSYLDHTEDPNQPAGVIEGGPNNYEGKGLKLKGGKDRMRTEYLPYYLDHGIHYRQRVRAGSISYDISPIANQDTTLYESDLDLERKQWGSWNQPRTNSVCLFKSLFRSNTLEENPTELPYPWITRFDVFQRIPLHRERPSTIVPLPDPDWRFAASNHLIGFVPKMLDDLSVEESLIRQKKLLSEWKRLERLYNKTQNPKFLDQIKEIKFALFGIPDFSDTGDEMLRIVTEIAMNRARDMLHMQSNDYSMDPEIIEYHLTKLSSGEIDPSSNYDGPEKTVALNLFNYKPISKKFRLHTTIEEMAETYHTLITENRREGRAHTRTAMALEPEYKHYPLRKYRKNFPSLEADYRPVWSNKSYGSEFGDAIRRSQRIPEDDLTEFDKPLRKRKKRLTKQERKTNFRDDYYSFNKEYNY